MLLRLALSLVLAAVLGVSATSAAVLPSGSLRVGSDISYAPVEFYKDHSKQVTGLDYDLAQELGKRMGVRVAFTNHDFNSIVPALKAGKYDILMSAMSDNRAREKQVDFVDYFLAGNGMLVPKGNPNHIFSVGELCGRTVDLQKGTSQETLVRAQSERCKAIGLGEIKLLTYTTDDQAFAQLVAGKSQVHISDYPVVAYQAKTYNGGNSFEVVGRQFGVVPYGIAVDKKNRALRDAIQNALVAVINDGTYDKILAKWGLTQGALRSAPISAGTLFQ